MIKPISEPLDDLSVEDRLERAKKSSDHITSTASAGGLSDKCLDELYFDLILGVFRPKGIKK